MEGDIPIKVSLKVDGERILAFLPPDVHGKRVLVDPLWVMTGALTVPRKEHTATLLPNGKVLAVGGQNGSTYLSSAELYNPTTGTTHTVPVDGAGAPATLLQSGKVLVAGGEGSGGILGQAYESGNRNVVCDRNHWRRALHTATLLPNGKVLVVAKAQFFRCRRCVALRILPQALFPALPHPRSAPRATRRSFYTGKVLVAGGYNSSYRLRNLGSTNPGMLQ